MLSATLALSKRGLMGRVHVPAAPLVCAASGAEAVERFSRIVSVVKGMRNAVIGLFGPRPRDFETCNYNIASIMALGVEVEELGFFDLANRARLFTGGKAADIEMAMRHEMPSIPPGEFGDRLAAYEKAVLSFRDELRLSGMTSQCWAEQERALKHVPCYVNARMASRGFPVACENDAYSLVSELAGQYASGGGVTVLDLNHSIPPDLSEKLHAYPVEDLVGLFHCGNTDPARLSCPSMKFQVIMNRLMEPAGQAPDITRGTIEGPIKASPITVLQVHGEGDGIRAYVMEGEFLDLDPKTFGCTGTAYIPGFRRFYRHVLLGRFHHHAAVAFEAVGGIVYDALKLLGVEKVYTPLGTRQLYEGENPFEK
jgi:L-fucose isomerase-like protein